MPGDVDPRSSLQGSFWLSLWHSAGRRRAGVVQEVQGKVTGSGEGQTDVTSDRCKGHREQAGQPARNENPHLG